MRELLIQVRKTVEKKFCIGIVLTAVLFPLGACTNRAVTSTKRDVTSQTSVNTVRQVDGNIDPSRILQVESYVEPNDKGVLLTSAGDVSNQGDRIVQVVNFAKPERSLITISDSNGKQLIQRELSWLVGPVAFSSDGQQIITSGSDLTTRIWDLKLDQVISFDGHKSVVQSLQLSPDGNYILTVEYPDFLPATEPINSNVAVARLLDRQATQLGLLEGLPVGSFQSVQFSPDSQRLLTVVDGVVQLRDPQGNPQLTFNQNQQKFSVARFSPDGRSVLAAGQGAMQLWDNQGNLGAEFRNWTLAPDENITSIQLNNNSQLIVTGSSKGLLRFWNSQSNEVLTVQGHAGAVHAIAISPDGTQVATLGEKGENAVGNNIRLWNLQGDLLEVFEGNLSNSYSIQFSSDGSHLTAVQMGQIGATIQWQLR